MEMRFWMSIIIPAIFLIPAVILHFVKKGLIKKALIKYQQYEDGEIEEEDDTYYDGEDVNTKYVHVSYDSIEQAETAFGTKYKYMVIALSTIGIVSYLLLNYMYLDFKKNLIFEGPTQGTIKIKEGSDIPRTRFAFDVTAEQLDCDLHISFNGYLDDFYTSTIFVQVYDPVDSTIVFEMAKTMEGYEDSDENIAFASIDTTLMFSKAGHFVLDYYAETTNIPDGSMYVKANASVF